MNLPTGSVTVTPLPNQSGVFSVTTGSTGILIDNRRNLPVYCSECDNWFDKPQVPNAGGRCYHANQTKVEAPARWRCKRCGDWFFKLPPSNISCLVVHSPDDCCHYTDVKTIPPTDAFGRPYDHE
jgi:hypothetical protein